MFNRDNIKVEHIQLSNIPCLYVTPLHTSTNFPAVILYHGWVSNKERLLFLANLFAQVGYHVVVPDAYLHGERGEGLDYKAETRHRYFWEVVIWTVQEGNDLLNSAIADGYVNPERMAIVGESMGGFIASGLFAQQQNFKCLVNINGSAAWEFIEHQFRNAENRPPATEQCIERIRRLDPLQHLKQMVRRPILILHGDSDTIMPIDSEREFYKKASPFYEDIPEKLKFVEIPRMNHYVSYGMLEEVFSWLSKYL